MFASHSTTEGSKKCQAAIEEEYRRVIAGSFTPNRTIKLTDAFPRSEKSIELVPSSLSMAVALTDNWLATATADHAELQRPLVVAKIVNVRKS